MGAWSYEPFGNDTAADWAYGLAESEGFSYIEETLDRVLVSSDYLEAPDAEEGIAAVEVLAKILGKGTQSDAYTEETDAWVAALKQKPDAALLNKAQQVLQRVMAKGSELLDLWAEAEEAEAWKASVAALDAAMR